KRRALVERFLFEVCLHKAFTGLAPPKRMLGLFARSWPVGKWLAAAAVLLIATGVLILVFSTTTPTPKSNPSLEVASSEIEKGRVKVNGVGVSRLTEKVPFEVAGNEP